MGKVASSCWTQAKRCRMVHRSLTQIQGGVRGGPVDLLAICVGNISTLRSQITRFKVIGRQPRFCHPLIFCNNVFLGRGTHNAWACPKETCTVQWVLLQSSSSSLSSSASFFFFFFISSPSFLLLHLNHVDTFLCGKIVVAL